jgi:putative hydrolase of the HAD superfamily
MSQLRRAAFFDLVGTLIEVQGGVGTQYARIASEFGVNADPKAIDAAFPQAFRTVGRLALANPDRAELASLEKGFWKDVVQLVFAQIGLLGRFADRRFDSYFERLYAYFATADGWLVYPDVVPALERLRRDGVIVGLLTNFDQRVFPLIDALDLGRLIDSVTIPAVSGAAKPARAIFEYALARHGVEAANAVQVGDSIDDDVHGARAVGMAAVLVDRTGRFGRRDVPTGTLVISSLDELSS